MGLFEERHERRMRDPEYAAAYAEADAELSSVQANLQIATIQLQALSMQVEIEQPYVEASPPLEVTTIDEPSVEYAAYA